MASTPIVSFDDVASRYLEGNLLDQFTREQVETQIADAVDYAAGRWGTTITSRLSGGQLSANFYKRVIANAVLRVLRNPEGYTSESEGGYSYGLRATVSSGDLWFTDDEIAMLSGAGQTLGPTSFGLGLDRGWG
jgi:hypothetical protein